MSECQKCKDLNRENRELRAEVEKLRGEQPKPEEPKTPPTYIATPMQVATPDRRSIGFRNPWNSNPARDL